MNIENFDLNLLISFDTLMRERNVSRAAEKLNISQPAMSSSLKRLRQQFEDPLLVRTTHGMEPTPKALELEPLIRKSLDLVESALSPQGSFEPSDSQRVFRLLVSDYVESTLILSLVDYLRTHAPNVTLDVLTLSDGSFQDLEKGSIDLAINRFDSIPQSFYQRLMWRDGYSCLTSLDHPLIQDNTMETYLESSHIWVSKTGIGVATGMSQDNVRGWVDKSLNEQGFERQIRVFTRHYQIIPLLVRQTNLVATLPTRAALHYKYSPELVIIEPPFNIPPIEIQMVWSPILHHNSAHKWIRQTLVGLANDMFGE